MILGDFRAMFLDFIVRKDVSAAQALRIINLAKLSLQRDYDLTFAKSKLIGQIYTPGGFPLPVDFKKFFGENSVVVTDSNGNITPLEGTTERVVFQRAKALGSQRFPPSVVNSGQKNLSRVGFYAEFLNGSTTPTLIFTPEAPLTFDLYYLAWLPNYVNDGEEDFLLARGTDALLFAAFEIYNSFAMTEEKIPIDQGLKAMKMDKLSEYCTTLERSGTHIYEG